MRMRILGILFASMMVLPLAAFAGHGHGGYGQQCGKCGGGDKGGHPDLDDKFRKKSHFLMIHREELGLSDEQMATIKEQGFVVERAEIEMKAKKKLAMLDLYQEMHKPNPDRTKMKTKIDEKIEAKRAYAYAALDALYAVHDVLSEDQKAKMKAIFLKEKYSSPSH